MQLKHSPEKLMDVILMPIVFLVLFLYVFGGAVAGSTNAYLEMLLPGLFAQMAMFAAMGLGTALCEDIHKGVFDRFRSLPAARSAPLVGAVLGDAVRFFVVMAVLTGFGSALGFRFHASVPSILAAYAPEPTCSTSAVCWVSVLVGLVAPSPQTVQGISFIWTMPLVFGSSVLLANTASMPGWLQAWVKVNPVTDLADSVRALTIGGPVGMHICTRWPGRPGSCWSPSRWPCGCTPASCNRGRPPRPGRPGLTGRGPAPRPGPAPGPRA